jgi:two-component system OmpR family sensor kinase
MNKQQQNTFYKFLSLYLISSYILLTLLAVLYYNSQKQLAHVDAHFKLHEQANTVQNKLDNIINTTTNINEINNDFNFINYGVEFINKNAKTLGNKQKYYPNKVLKSGTFDIDHACLLVKKYNVINKHDIWGYVLTDKSLEIQLKKIKYEVLLLFTVIAVIIALLGFYLSKLFLKPINDYIENLNNFVKDMNHELNTPITSLMMISKELNKEFDNRLIKSVVISTKQLYEIYQTLLDINFNLKHKTQKLDLKNSLEESINYFNEILISKNIVVHSKIDNMNYIANKEKIQRVFNNLISNAIKYSSINSKIEITLQNNTLIVKDYGIGIKKELQSKIFDRFYTEHKDTRGFGIGLDVIKKICIQYNINIQVISKEKEGTSFILSF